MNRKEKIQKEIDKTLEMFEQKNSLPPNPYFFTRVQQRLNEKSKKEFSIFGILKPALLTVLFLLNIGTFFWQINANETYTQVNSQKELIEILTGDLKLEQDKTNLFNIAE